MTDNYFSSLFMQFRMRLICEGVSFFLSSVRVVFMMGGLGREILRVLFLGVNFGRDGGGCLGV